MYDFMIKDPCYNDRAVYSDFNPLDGGQSLYPMGTVILFRLITNPLPIPVNITRLDAKPDVDIPCLIFDD